MADFDFVFTTKLGIRVLLEGSMILIEVVQTVVYFGILEVLIERESYFAFTACSPIINTLCYIVVANLEIVNSIRLSVKQKGQAAEEH